VAYERFIDGTALAPAERSRYLTAVATAMAEHGALDDAGRIAAAITRPLDRARSFLAIARAAAAHSQERARAALGTALLTAHQGREEAFRLLEQATPVLAALGGAALLTDLAAAIDEIDGW
jgi:phytoene/squalene synthetase